MTDCKAQVRHLIEHDFTLSQVDFQVVGGEASQGLVQLVQMSVGGGRVYQDIINIGDDEVQTLHDFIHDAGKGRGAASETHGAPRPAVLAEAGQREGRVPLVPLQKSHLPEG